MRHVGDIREVTLAQVRNSPSPNRTNKNNPVLNHTVKIKTPETGRSLGLCSVKTPQEVWDGSREPKDEINGRSCLPVQVLQHPLIRISCQILPTDFFFLYRWS